jgi:hypothetical protein
MIKVSSNDLNTVFIFFTGLITVGLVANVYLLISG